MTTTTCTTEVKGITAKLSGNVERTVNKIETHYVDVGYYKALKALSQENLRALN
jgi:hypothetical protein